jgi:hypothetical protein
LERKKSERKPLTLRARKILWLGVGIAPAVLYPALAYVVSSTGYEGQTDQSVESIVGAFIALGIIVLFFNLSLLKRTRPEENDTAFIICLALAEAISIEGFVLFLLVGWTWGFWAMIIMGLMSAMPLRPRGQQA